MRNQECFDKNGKFLGWFSRSIAVVGAVFCENKEGQWCVLASQRGKGTPDPEFVGKWNIVCGYLDYDETLRDAIHREVYEETGVNLNPHGFRFDSINDKPNEDKRQNVTIRYSFVIKGKKCDDITFSHEHNEKDEVGDIKFIPLSDIDKYEWAFNHNRLVKEIAHRTPLT